MTNNIITAVGIDVSKGKSMVAIRRPGGEVLRMPFEVKHNTTDLKSLIKLLKQIGGEVRIVMEHTGTYWYPIARTLESLVVSACSLCSIQGDILSLNNLKEHLSNA